MNNLGKHYKMKYTCNVFGIVDHRADSREFKSVYICDERATGPKSADTTISFLNRYIEWLPDWINGLTLVADNAATNKNYYILAWAMELDLGGGGVIRADSSFALPLFNNALDVVHSVSL